MLGRTTILASALLLAACGPKAPVVVVVNVDRVAHESVRAKKAVAEVEAYAKSVEDQLNDLARQIQAASTDPRRNPADVEQMKAQWGRMSQTAQQQVAFRQRQVEDQIHQDLDTVIRALAKEQGWDLVVRKSRGAALWAGEGLDKTDLVIQRMDSLAPAAAAPGAGA
jgi:Skp family chaperone for outer membrane proteins